MENLKPLLKQLVKGNEEAFDKIYLQFHHQVFLYCLKITKSSHLSEDIMQEVFITLWKKRQNINTDLSFDAFLFKITRDLSINYLKKAAREKNYTYHLHDQLTEQHQRNETELEVNYNEYFQIAQEAIHKLPPKRRKIFKMNHFMGMTYDAIGEKLGISKNTVKAQLVKAMQHMKAYLTTQGEITIFILFINLICW